MLKIVNNEAPVYLGGLLPSKIGLNRPASRTSEDFCIPKCRTQTFQSCFIPLLIRIWNNCAPEQWTIKYAVKNMFKDSHLLYCLGDRSTKMLRMLNYGCRVVSSMLNSFFSMLEIYPRHL